MNDASSMASIARVLFARYRLVSGDVVHRDEQFRTIAVVGAGASHAACGLPLGKTLAKRVTAGVVKAGIPRHFITRQLDRLEKTTRLERGDFETQLLALSKFDPTTVLELLREECDFAHYPNLTYEILAHLMKHGFLDAIINFNFDELLDQAIDEEMSSVERYARIVRDGEWARELRADGIDGFRFDRPLYIKPHGTVSEPASLRFTRDAYFDVPPDMAELLRVLLHGASAQDFVQRVKGKRGPSQSQRRRVCVLAIGHALESFEFNELLDKSPPDTQLHVVTLANSTPEKRMLRWPSNMQAFVKDRWIPISKRQGALDQLLVGIWKEVKTQAEVACRTRPWMCVRDIERHHLIARLFRPHRRGHLLRIEPTSKSTPAERRAIKTYLGDRVVIEAALAVAKAKGFIDIRELYRGRTGRFYRRLCEVSEQEPPPLTSYLLKLGMQQRDSSRESYWHQSVPSSSADIRRTTALSMVGEKLAIRVPPIPKRLTVKREACESTCDQLIAACKPQLSKHRRDNLNKKGGEALMRATLRAMFEGDDVELVTERRTRWQFVAARPVRTFAELRRETHKLLGSRLELLLCVAEAGNWLLDPDFRPRLAGCPIGAIVADPVSSEELGRLECAQVKWLPWHLHNRHMTIRCASDENGQMKPNCAIYFERRYRAAAVSPVLLEDPKDLECALHDFTVYWLKAELLARNESEVLALEPRMLKQEQQRMIRDIYLHCTQREFAPAAKPTGNLAKRGIHTVSRSHAF